MVLNMCPLDWESSALTTRPLLCFSQGPLSLKSEVDIVLINLATRGTEVSLLLLQ